MLLSLISWFLFSFFFNLFFPLDPGEVAVAAEEDVFQCASFWFFFIFFLLDPEDAMAAEEDVFQCAYFCPLVHLVTQDLDPTGIFWVEFCAWVKLFLGKILYLVHLVTKDLDPTGIFWGGY
jgi:hypothetical protein